MVDPVTRILPTFASSPTRIDTSTSITSEPESAWAAARQSHITADLLKLKRAREREGAAHHETDGEIGAVNERDTQEREGDQPPEHQEATDDQPENHTLSGESDEIGTKNFDDDTPFGTRVAIV